MYIQYMTYIYIYIYIYVVYMYNFLKSILAILAVGNQIFYLSNEEENITEETIEL